jgi:hypothetical protein
MNQGTRAQMVGGRRRITRGSKTKASKAAQSAKPTSAAPTPTQHTRSSSPTAGLVAGIAGFLDAVLHPDGGTLMMESPEQLDDTPRTRSTPRRQMKKALPKSKTYLNRGNKGMRAKHSIGQPRSTGGNH